MKDPNAPSNPPKSELDLYDFELPRDLIAQEPPANRTDSRMMVVDRRSGRIDHASIKDLPSHLRAGDAIVVNDSKVIPARLVGYREKTRGRWEGLFLREENGIAELLSKTRGSLLPASPRCKLTGGWAQGWGAAGPGTVPYGTPVP